MKSYKRTFFLQTKFSSLNMKYMTQQNTINKLIFVCFVYSSVYKYYTRCYFVLFMNLCNTHIYNTHIMLPLVLSIWFSVSVYCSIQWVCPSYLKPFRNERKSNNNNKNNNNTNNRKKEK